MGSPLHVQADDGKVVYQNLCLPCHGAAGEGNAIIKSPSIAGLPSWYVLAQLENFQTGRRGAHPSDPEGQIMRSITSALTSSQTRDISHYVSTLTPVRPAAYPSVDLSRGRELYEERCMECHRYNGSGELAFRSPPLTGLQDWYIASQMRKYKAGIRGAAPDDEPGLKMVFSATFVEDDAMLESLAAYLTTLGAETKAGPPLEFGR